jgi:hypothetical protein
MPDIAQTYALEFFNNIKTKIDQAHRLAMGRLDTWRLDQKRPSSDWLGSKMMHFQRDIYKLSQLSEGLLLAVDLAL